MAIDPTKPSGTNPVPGARIDQAGGNQSSRPSGQVPPGSPAPTRDAPDPGEQVQLSPEARLAGQAEGATSASGMSRERLREVLKRLTSGYYDSPQVIDRVARKVSDELSGLPRI